MFTTNVGHLSHQYVSVLLQLKDDLPAVSNLQCSCHVAVAYTGLNNSIS